MNVQQMPAWSASQEQVSYHEASWNNTKLRKQREVHLEVTEVVAFGLSKNKWVDLF